MIRLVRDVLDNQLMSRDGVAIGKVDEIVLKRHADGRLEVAAIEVGGVAAARRLEKPLRAIAAWAARRWGVHGGRPCRIPWAAVRDIGIDIDVDVDASETPADQWERRVLQMIRAWPGA